MQLLQLIPYNDTIRTDKNKLSICTPFSGVALTFLKASEGLRLMVVVLFSKKKQGGVMLSGQQLKFFTRNC